MSHDILAAGRDFILREGRLVERRLAEVVFDGADPAGVIDAVRAFRNGDGGFGHGFEPDKRCPASLPIDVECALDALWAAGVGVDDMEGYGVTPLHYAATPESPWRLLFDDAIIEGHLDRMAGRQQSDGGWPITWEPPGAASALEWRGIETLRALRTLRAYGRIG